MDALPPRLIAIVGAVVFLAVAVFQVALALGVPLGELAWGGQQRLLPRSLRVGSALAAVIWLVAAVFVLERADVTALGLNDTVASVGVWVLTVLLAVGTIMNAISRSTKERLVMTPVAGVGFVVCLIVALSS
jgi:hypothetical protein